MPAELKKRVRAYWAPEVHAYRGKYYLFVTLTFPQNRRGTWIFRSEGPDGPFEPIAGRAVTPADWMCLDGALWVEDGKPYIVFCHEWIRVGNGYVDILCESASGKVSGPWVKHRFLFDRDGGHGMLFRTLDGQLTLTLHQPNNAPKERMRFFPVEDDGETLRLRTVSTVEHPVRGEGEVPRHDAGGISEDVK